VTTRIVVVRSGGPLPTGRVFPNRQLKPRSVGAFCPAHGPPILVKAATCKSGI